MLYFKFKEGANEPYKESIITISLVECYKVNLKTYNNLVTSCLFYTMFNNNLVGVFYYVCHTQCKDWRAI